MNHEDCVIKRNGEKEIISFDKILKRVKSLGEEKLNINYTSLTKIIDRLYDGISTTLIDELTDNNVLRYLQHTHIMEFQQAEFLSLIVTKIPPIIFLKVVKNYIISKIFMEKIILFFQNNNLI